MVPGTVHHMNALPPIAVMQRVVDRRDADFDGVFVVAVRTTGIFCRPSCPARPLPKNRLFFPTPADALRAGYRPCKRCKPLLAGGGVPDWLGRLLDRVEADPAARLPDKELRALGVDPVAARRHFLHHFGMTFQAYCRGRRLGEAFRQLKRGQPLDTIAVDHGYESLSGFRDAFAKAFGGPPRQANGSWPPSSPGSRARSARCCWRPPTPEFAPWSSSAAPTWPGRWTTCGRRCGCRSSPVTTRT